MKPILKFQKFVSSTCVLCSNSINRTRVSGTHALHFSGKPHIIPTHTNSFLLSYNMMCCMNNEIEPKIKSAWPSEFDQYPDRLCSNVNLFMLAIKRNSFILEHTNGDRLRRGLDLSVIQFMVL